VAQVQIYIKMLFIFSTPVLIRHLWQLKTVVFLHWCLICPVLSMPTMLSVVMLNVILLIVTAPFGEMGNYKLLEPWRGKIFRSFSQNIFTGVDYSCSDGCSGSCSRKLSCNLSKRANALCRNMSYGRTSACKIKNLKHIKKFWSNPSPFQNVSKICFQKWNGVAYLHCNLQSLPPQSNISIPGCLYKMGSTRVGSSLAQQKFGKGKRCWQGQPNSLLRYGTNYDRKMFYSSGPRAYTEVKMRVVLAQNVSKTGFQNISGQTLETTIELLKSI
jgi:hypothetical protein